MLPERFRAGPLLRAAGGNHNSRHNALAGEGARLHLSQYPKPPLKHGVAGADAHPHRKLVRVVAPAYRRRVPLVLRQQIVHRGGHKEAIGRPDAHPEVHPKSPRRVHIRHQVGLVDREGGADGDALPEAVAKCEREGKLVGREGASAGAVGVAGIDVLGAGVREAEPNAGCGPKRSGKLQELQFAIEGEKGRGRSEALPRGGRKQRRVVVRAYVGGRIGHKGIAKGDATGAKSHPREGAGPGLLCMRRKPHKPPQEHKPPPDAAQPSEG